MSVIRRQEERPSLEARFAAMQASAALDHLRRLDEGWARLLRDDRPPAPLSVARHSELPGTDGEYDIIYAGGGLGLLHAMAMQARGWRVLLFDRRPTGQTHREWNISRPELAVLVEHGILSWEELAPAIAREYDRSFIRFHDPRGKPVRLDLPGVLDLALNANRLLTLVRQKFEAAGGDIREGCSFQHAWLACDGAPRAVVRVRESTGGCYHAGARLLVNGLGALSPLSLALAGRRRPIDGVCPTVGTVARGFAPGEVDPQTGEILVTLEGARAGRQLIWEGFPGDHDHLTIYLFYYDLLAGREPGTQSLLDLYKSYFDLLPRYKQPGDDFEHLRPVYGYIPARHHLDGPPAERARTARGLLSIGDAAARQNPLTFTGFGSFVRHLPRSIDGLDIRLREGALAAEELAGLGAEQGNLSGMWVLARFLTPRPAPDDVNGILRDFTRALGEVEPQRAVDFFLDRASWRDYVEILLRTARHHPGVLREAFQLLGPRGVARWLEDLARWKWQEQRAATRDETGQVTS